MDSLQFLDKAGKSPIQSLYVVAGDDEFLKRLVLKALRTLVLGPEGDEIALSTYPGDKADYAAVMDEVATPAFFGPRRLVIVENADPFVSNYRARLETVVGQLPGTGVLVLEVKTWTATTRLAKMIPSEATLICKAPTGADLNKWCVRWAQTQHGKQLTATAATLLVELIGPELGLLDKELEKLAVYVGNRARISEEDVDKLVNRSQAQEAWKIFDAIGEGKLPEALALLHRLLDQGDDPFRIIGALSLQIRRLVKVGRLLQQGKALNSALAELGINAYFGRSYQQQLRHLGPRVGRLYEWLLELQLDLRGANPLPPQTLLERFVIRLARPEKPG